jgi:hypothetical protein
MGPITLGLWGTLPGSRYIWLTDRQTSPLSADILGRLLDDGADRNEEPIEKSDGLQGIEAHFTG